MLFELEPVGQAPTGAPAAPQRPRRPGQQMSGETQLPALTVQPDQPAMFELETVEAPRRDDMFLGEFGRTGPGKQIRDFSIGFNNMMIDTLGIAPEAADRLLKAIGTSGFLDEPGDGVEMVRSAARDLGITISADPETLAERIGRSTFQQGLLTAATFAAAPAAAASTVGGAGAAAVREIGKFVLARPGATLAGEAGAVLGSEVGQQLSPEGYEWVGGLVGGMVGGGIGMGAATRGPRNPNRGKINTVARRDLGREAIPDNITPVAKGARFPDYGQISQSIKSDQMRIESLIKNTLDNVRLRTQDQPDSVGAAELTRDAVRAAYKRARGLESRYWSQVDQSKGVSTAPIKKIVNDLIKSTTKEVRGDVLPGEDIQRILGLKGSASIKTLTDIRSIILEKLSAHTMDPTKVPKDKLRKSLDTLQGAIIDEIQRQHPNDEALTSARAFSTWLHDRFTRGPTSRFSPRQQTDLATQAPDQVMDGLVRDSRGGRELADIGTNLDPAVRSNAEQFIRERFREVADADPTKGEKWLNSPATQRFIKAFPELDKEAADITNSLRSVLDDQKAFNDSAFIRAAKDEGPQVAVGRLFTSANKVVDARNLMRRLDGDPAAQEALQDALVREFLNRASVDPSRAMNLFRTKDTTAMMGEILPSGRLGRLQRITAAAERQLAGSGSVSSEVYRQTVGRASRILGAFVGRWINSASGSGGTIQVPGQTADAAFAMQNSLMKDFSPQDLFANAVADPRWERFLMQRTPETRQEWERTFRQMRALIATKQSMLEQELEVGGE